MESIIYLLVLIGIIALLIRIIPILIPFILVVWVIGYFLGKKNKNTPNSSNNTGSPDIIEAEFTETEVDE